jgi:hypothetical protein
MMAYLQRREILEERGPEPVFLVLFGNRHTSRNSHSVTIILWNRLADQRIRSHTVHSQKILRLFSLRSNPLFRFSSACTESLLVC